MNRYSDEEFARIVEESSNYKDCLQNLGYHSSSLNLRNALKKKINGLNLDVSHFNTPNPVKRTEENIFIENSTVDQATLRRWYKKGNYSEYKCSICGLNPFWNGKDLSLILDHINGHNKDDRLENLRWVCPNCNQQLDTTGSRNRAHKEHNINLCVDCGKPITPKAARCVECERKHRIECNVYQRRPPREELKELIRTTPFTKIGEKFGVTDNAVRKWCSVYNLPKKVSDIKKLTDEEWLNI